MSSKLLAMRLIGVATIIFVAVGCTPVSEHPLSDEQSSELDARLLGKWEAKGTRTEEGPYTISVRRKAESATGLEAFDIFDPNKQEVEDTAPLYATKIGEHDYLTLEARILDPKTNKEKAQFLLLQYRFIDGDTVSIYEMQEKVIVKAIADGQLKGRYFGPAAFTMSCVVISDSAENLRHFLEKHGDKCFASDPLFVFTKSD